ncbi:MAG: four helix bundle protein [Cyclobacteriaceae bacterium]
MAYEKKFIPLRDLEIYQLSRQLSKMTWNIYQSLSFEDKKVMGDQFIRSADSVGANIAEGYHRYHYLDKIRFYYYSRGSLSECIDHWLDLLQERQKISPDIHAQMTTISKRLQVKLNNFISATHKSVKK